MAKKSPKMTAAKRKRLASKTFAIRGERAYPMDTLGRARNARARVRQHGTPAEQKRVFNATARKYPSLKSWSQWKKKGR